MASTFRRRRSSDDGVATTTTAISGGLWKGTKAWTSGTMLTSTGLRELDNILLATTASSSSSGGGGGQPIGSCLYLELDRTICGGSVNNGLGHALIRYWCAEALSQEQVLLIPTSTARRCDKCTPSSSDANLESSAWSDDEESPQAAVSNYNDLNFVTDLLSTLPRNLHKDRDEEQQQQQAETVLTAAPLDTLAEEDDNENDADDEEGLVVAWQYRKDVQQERLGLSSKRSQQTPSKNSTGSSSSSTATIYCHSYDLQGRLSDQMSVQEAVVTMEILGCCCCCCGKQHNRRCRCCGFNYFRQLVEQVQSLIQAHPRRIIRILLYNQVKSLAVALPLFLNYIRRHRLPVVVLVAVVQPWTVVDDDDDDTTSSALRHLQRCADVVLESESFVARNAYPPPPEFRHLHGLLKVRKAATCTLATAAGHFANLTVQKRPTATLYGLKRDRRKLHISLLHIPPEDYAAHGGMGSGNVRSGAGRSSSTTSVAAAGGCGTSGGGGGGNSPLDF